MTTQSTPLATGYALSPEQGGTGLDASEAIAGQVPTTDGNGNFLLQTPATPPAAVLSIVAGTNITVNAADPQNPIVAATFTPGGATTQVQYNNAGALAGNANFTYDAANNVVTFGTAAGKVNGATDPLDVFTMTSPAGSLLSVATGQVGAIKIALPAALYALDFSVKLRAEIFDSQDNKACTIMFSGSYVGAAHAWNANESVQIVATDATADYAIRDGNDGTSPCLWIGELATTWGTLRVQVADVMLTGFAANQALAFAATGWALSIATAFGTVSSVITDNLVYATATSVYAAIAKASVDAGPTALVSGTAKTIASIVLPAGTWLVTGGFIFEPGATTVVTYLSAGLSTVNNTLPLTSLQFINPTAFPAGITSLANAATPQIITSNGVAPTYLVMNANFTVSVLTARASIRAIRVG